MTEHTDAARTLPFNLRPSDLWTAAATGVLTLPDPARRNALTRFALRSAVAGTTGLGTWIATGEDPEHRYDVPFRAAFTVGAVGLVYGAAELGEAMDRALQRRLLRMGVRRPRMAMAVAGVGLALGLSVLERRADDARDGSPEDDAPDGPTYRELPSRVRDLIEAILARTEDHDSLRLRAQLAVAREELWGEGDEAERFVGLAVPDDVPLAVPRNFTFPVSAHFTSSRGVPCMVQLLIDRGTLSAVILDIDGPTWEAVAEDWEPGDGEDDPLAGVTWPALEDVTIVAEDAGRS